MDSPLSPPDPEDASSEEEEGGIPEYQETDQADLKRDVHMEGNQAVGTLTAVGKAFRPKRAEAIPIADLIRSFALALYKIALEKSKLGDVVAPTDLDDFRFASAHIRFIAGEHETMRMDEGGSPTIEAARQISSLMQAAGDDLLALAQETGPEGAKAYKQFMRAVSQAEDAEVTWQTTGAQEAITLTSVEASKAFLILDREGEAEDQELEAIPGHLSMADAGVQRFKLVLPRSGDFDRPTPLKGKKVIEGHYDDPVGELVKSKGLWDRDVVATIRIEREREDTVATPRKPSFHLVAVEAAVERPEEGPKLEPPVIQTTSLLDDEDQAG